MVKRSKTKPTYSGAFKSRPCQRQEMARHFWVRVEPLGELGRSPWSRRSRCFWGTPETSEARGRAGGGEAPRRGSYSAKLKSFAQFRSNKIHLLRSNKILKDPRIATAQAHQGLQRRSVYSNWVNGVF